VSSRTRVAGGGAAENCVDGLKKALRAWPWLAAIATGLLYAGCFPPFDQSWLCWFALTPLLAAIWFSGKKNSRRRGLRDLLLGYVAGLTFFWIVFSWLTTVTVAGWFLLQFYMAIYVAVWSWFCGMLRPRVRESAAIPRRKHQWPPPQPNESQAARIPWLSSLHNLYLALALAAAWTALEWLRGWVLEGGWGWNGLGVALYLYRPIIQIAEFTGVAGISFLVAFANVIALSSVYRFILESKIRQMRPHYDLTLTMAAVVGVAVYGFQTMQIRQPAMPLRVALVQANVPREEKFTPQFAMKIFDQFSRLSEMALKSNPNLELLVWPESSMPGPVLEDKDSNEYVMEFAAHARVDLLLGAIDQDETHAYNAALLVAEGGKRLQLYRKLHLVPFGEYVPGRNWVPLLARIIGDQVPADFDAGTDYTIFRITNKDVQVAPLICFEDTIGELARRFVLKGANLLVNVTNDGWFLRSAGSRQHLANAVFRCVETRRPMVRAANTGVTCFINEFGRITQMLTDEHGSQFTDGVLSGDTAVPTERQLTFYTRHGELFAQCCAGLALLTVTLNALPKFRRKPEAVEIDEPVSA
jgi:apolipoprotein N-acyltransferase